MLEVYWLVQLAQESIVVYLTITRSGRRGVTRTDAGIVDGEESS